MAGSDWARIHLGPACTKIGSGATPRGGSESYLASGPYALIRSQNIYNDGFHREGLAFISERQANDLNNVAVEAHDVLLNITGDSVARCCQVDASILPARVNQHVSIIRPDPTKLDPRFLRYFLISPEMQARMLSWAGAGGTRNALTKSMIESFELLAPRDVHEQRAIGQVLGALDDKIELNRRMSETLETMARAMFKSWFVDFDPVRAKVEARDAGLPKDVVELFPDSFVDSELGDIPRGWTVDSAYSIADVIYGAPFQSSLFNEDGVGEPLIRIRDLADEDPGVWTTEVHPRGYKVRPGDIVVGMDGAFRAHLWGGVESWLNQRVCVFQPREGWSAAFVRNSIAPLLADVEATETATTVIHLGKADIDRFRVVLPEEGVARAFNGLAQAWYQRIVDCKQESLTLAALRDALLPRLISGSIRVSSTETLTNTGS